MLVLFKYIIKVKYKLDLKDAGHGVVVGILLAQRGWSVLNTALKYI